MIVKCQNYKHLMVTLLGILAVICLGLSACSGSECSSRVATLEAQIQNLQSENRQLKSETQQLEADKRRLTQDLQDIHSLVNSPSYANTLDDLTQVQSNTSALAAFVGPLPALPPLPQGLTVTQIDDAIEQAIDGATALRALLHALPSPPPFPPPPGPWSSIYDTWIILDSSNDEFLDLTNFVGDLEDLPEFLAQADSLKDLKSRIESYLGDVENTASDASTMLEKIKDAASP